jgi:hypothetical protein
LRRHNAQFGAFNHDMDQNRSASSTIPDVQRTLGLAGHPP